MTDEQADGRDTATGGPGRDARVRRVLYLEGAANVVILIAKLAAGLATGSLAILGDAAHSFTDLGNNVVAIALMRVAGQPADRGHPYGHRKFETLAIFILASLLTFTALELGLRAVTETEREVQHEPWALGLLGGVMVVNLLLSAWEGHWAKRLDSDVLRADVRHTLGDVLTTGVVIVGWQLAALGYGWVDSVFALVVAGLVLYMAYGLFKRAVPVLVDGAAVDPDLLATRVQSVDGVERILRVRSRTPGEGSAVDLVVTVSPKLSLREGHEVADEIEALLREEFEIEDVLIHVEPDH